MLALILEGVDIDISANADTPSTLLPGKGLDDHDASAVDAAAEIIDSDAAAEGGAEEGAAEGDDTSDGSANNRNVARVVRAAPRWRGN